MIDLKYLFQNFFVNKFELKYAKRIAADILHVKALRNDEFGRAIEYNFFFLSHLISSEQIAGLKRQRFANPIFVGKNKQEGIDFTEVDFFDKLSTVVDPGIYLHPDLSNILSALGHNQVLTGIIGSPADLLEVYSKECLQFLLGGKGRRYGKERSFESLPDGAILGRDVTILFDAKAYKDGFNPSADDLKRFENYIKDFNKKYEQFAQKVYCFIVISGHFQVGVDALNDRSRELYEMCQTALVFVSSEVLSQLVELAIKNATLIHSFNWKRIFSNPVTNAKNLFEQIEKIKKDRIL